MSETKTIESIIEEIDNLMEVDVGKLDSEAIRNNKIFTTVQRYYIQAVNNLTKATIRHDATKNTRYRYYNGKATQEEYKKEPLRESFLKGDIEGMLKIDVHVVRDKMAMIEAETLVKYLEEAKWRIKSRGDEIRMAIDFQRMQLGM